jgi:branched-chain amino acid transport system ATP-binding protein
MTALLKLEKLTKSFGGLVAVDGFDMSVEHGKIVGLIGPNGAGKTTVYNMISGVFRPSRGKVIFKDESISGLAPHTIVSKGLARTFQQTTLFANMPVLQNILLGFHVKSRVSYVGALFNTRFARNMEKKLLDEAREIANFIGLGDKQYELARNLPHGPQRALEIAVALAAEPELLLLDEPTTGMNVEETSEMMRRIKQIRDRGITILLVEHDMKVVMGICDLIYVLCFGKKIAEGSPKEIQSNQEVIKAYLGDGVCY